MKPLVLVLAIAACSDPDPAPSATITMTVPLELAVDDDTRDDLVITVEYADADGDLGTGSARVHDCRSPSVVTELALPAIAPDPIVAGGAMITGSLELNVTDVGAIAPGTPPPACTDLGVAALDPGTVVFCVVLTDAAGNVGLGDCTGAITLAE